MYLFHINDNNPIFILVLPFEQKETARAYGFTWNKPQVAAWATDSLSVACRPIKDGALITVAPATLDYLKAHTLMSDETFNRLKVNYAEPDRKTQAGIYAVKMTDEQVAAIHKAVKFLASVCDGSLRDDFAGFNRNDVEYGHNMADLPQLSRNQAAHCKIMVRKYRGQIGEELYKIIYPNQFAREQAAADKKAADKAQKEADRADKRAEKESPKLHKKGEFCNWSGCTACKSAKPFTEMLEATTAQRIADRELAPLKQPIQLPASTVANTFPDEAELEPAAQKLYDELLPKPTMPVGNFDVVQNIAQVAEPAAVVTVVKSAHLSADQQKADPEIIRLAISLIDCFAGDFDTTVDMLRALRKIDQPKEAKSDFTKAAWQAAGYQVKP